jgi:nucleotide-binding universal stress UspA family protein
VRSAERVLVLCEHGRAGAAAIDLARELAELEDAAVTVVGVAPRAPSGARCGNSAIEYNEAVADSVAEDLERARERLAGAASGATFVLLQDGADQTLEQFARSGGFDLVLLPARRRPLRGAYHPQAHRLEHLAGAEIRIVAPA